LQKGKKAGRKKRENMNTVDTCLTRETAGNPEKGEGNSTNHPRMVGPQTFNPNDDESTTQDTKKLTRGGESRSTKYPSLGG